MITNGTRVLYRFYNTPERRFYGEYQRGVVVGVDLDEAGVKHYTVIREGAPPIALQRKEIKRIIRS